jgi:hypothetical protein
MCRTMRRSAVSPERNKMLQQKAFIRSISMQYKIIV